MVSSGGFLGGGGDSMRFNGRENPSKKLRATYIRLRKALEDIFEISQVTLNVLTFCEISSGESYNYKGVMEVVRKTLLF